MPRVEGGELYFESKDATNEQLQCGVTAARQYLEKEGLDIRAALTAYSRRSANDQAELAWEIGEGEMPKDLSEREYELADIAEEAWAAALDAAGTNSGDIGLVVSDQAIPIV